MKVLVFGAGSLGSLIGAHLCARFDVRLVGRKGHMDAVRRQGLKITGSTRLHVDVQAYTEPPPHWIPDLLILSTKAYDTPVAIEAFRPVVGPRTTLVTIQNGLGNWEALRGAYPTNVVLAASVVYGARLEAPGHVVSSGQGQATVGGRPEDRAASDAVAEALTISGIEATAVDDIRGVLLAKALVNSVINPLTAVHRVPNAGILEPQYAQELGALVADAQALADAAPYPIPFKDIGAVVRKVAEATGKNQSSMLQDVLAGKPTERAAILGRLVEMARRWSVDVPAIEAWDTRLRGLAKPSIGS